MVLQFGQNEVKSSQYDRIRPNVVKKVEAYHHWATCQVLSC